MEQMPTCPKCQSEYVYHDLIHFVCPDCSYEWSGQEPIESDEKVVKDSNGNLLQDGDSVILIKDLQSKRLVYRVKERHQSQKHSFSRCRS